MKKQIVKKGMLPVFSLTALSMAISAVAQEADSDLSFNKPLEEVVVVGLTPFQTFEMKVGCQGSRAVP